VWWDVWGGRGGAWTDRNSWSSPGSRMLSLFLSCFRMSLRTFPWLLSRSGYLLRNQKTSFFEAMPVSLLSKNDQAHLQIFRSLWHLGNAKSKIAHITLHGSGSQQWGQRSLRSLTNCSGIRRTDRLVSLSFKSRTFADIEVSITGKTKNH
jgi:hypothetical protein